MFATHSAQYTLRHKDAIPDLDYIRSEIAAMRRRLREAAAIRLQCWIRHRFWKLKTLPERLLRLRVILHCTQAIQRSWRRYRGIGSGGRLTTIPPRRLPRRSSSGSRASIASSTLRDRSGSIQLRRASFGDRRARGRGEVSSFNPSEERARALVAGWKVRCAVASRSVQNKLRLRHDLYLLISDAEAESGEVSYRGAWVESLYASLTRAQAECLNEFQITLGSPVRPGGRQSLSKPLWRGWPRNLERMIGYRKPSQTSFEKSLVGSTTLRPAPDFSQVVPERMDVLQGLTPLSPAVDSEFGELRSQSFALTGSFDGFGDLENEGDPPDHSLTMSITPTKTASEHTPTPGPSRKRQPKTPIDISDEQTWSRGGEYDDDATDLYEGR